MSDLNVGDPATFIGEHESMDLSSLKDKLFLVAINSGDRGKGKFIQETSHGPYDFLEMVEEVSGMWLEYQHHSKVYVLSKNKKEPCQWLDYCTVDYIEAKAMDIVTNAFLAGDFAQTYTCKAGFTSQADADPRSKEKVESKEETEEQ